ncbi:MAG: enolase C-terminal domain-like protein [Isosphaeraceae bacterium]|nr:enolase C-terminal domain-like protein [Isosphaeraceae bacterium]
MLTRRGWLGIAALGSLGVRPRFTEGSEPAGSPLTITGLTVTPIALPDPPLLNAGGCHGPYFLRNVVELKTDAGIVGIGETAGGEGTTLALEKARGVLVGQNAFGYRRFARELFAASPAGYAGIELACLDACGRATGRRLCELLGGPARDPVEFSAYLFYRYAADHPAVLADERIKDGRGRGAKALDDWGEVRSPETMAAMAERFRKQWGFRVFKLKGGVLAPGQELETLKAMAAVLGRDCPLRIDPNGRWKVETALRIGQGLKGLPLEYYEDPVRGQEGMAAVRQGTGLAMSTNMCVTRFADLAGAFRLHPIDVLLGDLHYFGGFAGNLALGPVCDAAGWTMSQHSNNHAGVTMAAMIHLGAVVPQLTMAGDTHYPWLVEGTDIIEGPKLAIEGGRMAVPKGPGVGVTLDRDRVARAHETYVQCGMRRRDDGPLMRKLEPGWTGGLIQCSS